MRNMNENGKLIAGIIIGAVSGAAMGLLFAPSEGKKMRDKISKDIDSFSNDLMDKINHEAEIIKNKANSLMASSEGKAESIADKTKEKASEAEKATNNLKTEARTAAQDANK